MQQTRQDRRAKPWRPWAAAGPGQTTSHRAKLPISTPGPTGVEGAGGTGGPSCSARGRRRGLARQRATAPSHPSAHRAPLVWRAPEGPEGLAAVPVGGGRDRPRCWSAAAGPGRASRSTTPSEARVWRSRGRATADQHTQRPGPSRKATRRSKFSRALRRPEHPWGHKQHGPRMRKPRPADAGRGQPTQSGVRV